jgi:hypothetical protein
MFSRAVLALALFAAATAAQDPKTNPKSDPKSDEKPAPKVIKAPEGWGFHKAKDGSYSVLFPKDRAGISNSERTFNQNGFIGKQQVMACTLKDGRELVVIGTALGGPATKDLKISDVYDLMYDLDKQPGNKLSEPKEIQVGVRKGQEYFVTRKGEVERNVVVVVRGRVYQLVVTAKDRKGTADKTADTFLTSLILHAPKKEPDKKAAPAKKDKP